MPQLPTPAVFGHPRASELERHAPSGPDPRQIGAHPRDARDELGRGTFGQLGELDAVGRRRHGAAYYLAALLDRSEVKRLAKRMVGGRQ